MGVMNFINSAINWASPKISNFLSGASEFIGMTPKYLDEDYEKSFIKMIKKDKSGTLMSKYGDGLGDSYSSLSLQDRRKVYSNFKNDVRQTNAFNALDYDKFGIGNQKHLQDIYSAMTDPDFKDAYINHQISLGRRGTLGSKYKNFKFDNLNNEQLGVLHKEYAEEYAKRIDKFNSTYIPDGGNGPNYNYGLQQRYLNSGQGKELNASFFGNNKYARRNNKIIKKGGEQGQALEAYRGYLSGVINDVPDVNDDLWTPPKSFYDYASDTLTMEHEQAKKISKKIAMGDPDHSGIGIWDFAKNHPAIATGIATSAAFGISELFEEDDNF